MKKTLCLLTALMLVSVAAPQRADARELLPWTRVMRCSATDQITGISMSVEFKAKEVFVSDTTISMEGVLAVNVADAAPFDTISLKTNDDRAKLVPYTIMNADATGSGSIEWSGGFRFAPGTRRSIELCQNLPASTDPYMCDSPWLKCTLQRD